MIKLQVPEITRRGLYALATTQEWKPYDLPKLGTVAQMAETAGATMTFMCPPGRVGIWLLRHAWSGLVEITCAGHSIVVDLYAEHQDEGFFHYIDAGPHGAAEVVVRVLGRRNSTSGGDQVWVVGLAVEALPDERGDVLTLSPGCKLINAEWGRFLVLLTDKDIPNVIQSTGTWGGDDIGLFKACVRRGDAVLDVGANFGHHSVVFSQLVGPEGVVVSIEAQRVMYQLLNANCVLNGCRNVRTVHVAASDRPGKLTLYPIDYEHECNFGSLGINPQPPENAAAETVDAAPLDDLLQQSFPDIRIGFIKIDVQSYELFVLRGLDRCLREHRPFVFFEVSPHWMQLAGYDYRVIYEFLGGLGYGFRHRADVEVGAAGFPKRSLDDQYEWDVLAIPTERMREVAAAGTGRWR
ncbi:FkbM family methyltransferase [Azospirillum sp. TSH64]|uniref:FkbM family methyltransferase n=1 Tax=Azospirillum sp. TSH64 TaxID=652740 RepID=UPI000D6093C0|nr:FkbM family methyltransferase [Azospirillum sp. TSH64]PWC78157.1 hypothetical protein TSH64_28350 [Azospirillum sp. TSH64]PWC81573.1 hypothetical protein TSH64_00185 [Azospirillum sp. TSH64]